MRLQISGFGGETPRTSPTMLKETDATQALNVRLYSGELSVWKGPLLDFETETAGALTCYRFENPSTLEHLWLTWDVDVDVQPSSLDDVTDFRLYYTGDGTPKKTNWDLAEDASSEGPFPGVSLEMGVPAPETAPTVGATTGASLAAETRFYVYTYISTFGTLLEESAPSPPSASITITASQSVNVSAFATPPTTGYNITHLRVYRSLPGETTSGAFVFVHEIELADIAATYNDNLLAAATGEALTTSLWTEPPDDLLGLTSMANGMMAGFVGNTVYFCEPYFHHAWPVGYAQSVPNQIVGLSSFGSTLVVMTKGQPLAMTGITPSQITVEKIAMPEPCISKRSIAGDQFGVLYASPNGVVGIGPNVKGVITNQLFRRNEWLEYSPETMVGAIYDGKYFASYQSATKGNKTMVISRDDHPALSFLDVRSRGFFNEIQQGTLYYLEPTTNNIYQLDADELNPYTYEWVSKRFVFGKAVTFSALRLDISEVAIDENARYAEILAAIEASNEAIIGPIFDAFNDFEYNEQEINGSILQDVPPPGSTVTATVFLIDEYDVIRAALTIDKFDARRIPPFKSRDLRVKITGTLPVRSITLATTFGEIDNGGT